MSKADRDRQALLQRLAREQRRALDAAARDADRARTPRTAPTCLLYTSCNLVLYKPSGGI